MIARAKDTRWRFRRARATARAFRRRTRATPSETRPRPARAARARRAREAPGRDRGRRRREGARCALPLPGGSCGGLEACGGEVELADERRMVRGTLELARRHIDRACGACARELRRQERVVDT